uniref:BTB/POZ domain-containing protein n=1 Tax=Mirabilis jalapa TaxID=3538 RepID=B8YIB2_MIRJA|nr:BTB/POZ domain-containing protein [Mirabilis jalapa]
MKESCVYRVDTTSRLAQWRIDNLSSCSYRRSDPFRIGLWNWYLVVEKSRVLVIKLYPETSNITKENPPFASFIIRISSSFSHPLHCNPLIHPQVIDKQLKSNDDFVWPIDIPLVGKFIIDVEFLDLKISSSQSGELCSIWAEGSSRKRSNSAALSCLGRMLMEGIHTDIVINTSDGSVGAHRAVLASRSPVFQSMFSHDLQEKELSTINISDMSVESCHAFLAYLYGCIQPHEFTVHRLALLRASDKYDISDLKEACHQSLIEDIDAKNVLERLQSAALYQLPELKSSCMRYLVKFGKIFDIRDEFSMFIQCADRELITEVFQEILGTWKGF